jgi:hypothetical protein
MSSADSTSGGVRPLVLVTTVEIGGGLTGRIELRLGDSPEVGLSDCSSTTREAVCLCSALLSVRAYEVCGVPGALT